MQECNLETKHQVPAESVISCKYCPYLFSTRLQLIIHFEIRVKAGVPVDCDLCEDNRKYLRLGRLLEHYRAEHQVGGLQFVCEHCSKSFADKRKWKWHVSSVHIGRTKAPKEIFKCPEKDFDREASLMNHKIKFHGADPFKCSTCAEELNDWYAFVRHEREHKGVLVEEKDFSCDLPGCGKLFKSKKSLQLHKLSVTHVGQTNAFVCGKGFNHEGSLKSHQGSVHSEERKFVCEDCGERFKTGEVLRKHKRIHSGEKPFQCDICQQRFRFSEVLKRHVQAHQRKGPNFKPKGPMQNVRKRVNPK